jgi:hypothetical protein
MGSRLFGAPDRSRPCARPLGIPDDPDREVSGRSTDCEARSLRSSLSLPRTIGPVVIDAMPESSAYEPSRFRRAPAART